MLVDSHCHLDFPDFKNDLDGVVNRAADAGVGTMVTIGTKMSTFQNTLAIAESFPNIFCTVGIHPHEAETEQGGSTEELIALAAHEKVIGIGETGLDYFYEHSPKAKQQAVFRAHIAASRETQLPIVIHTRDADDDMIHILDDEMNKGAFPGLIHCFSSGAELAEKALSLGLYISISGIVTFKGAQDLRDVVQTLPVDRLLVETDSPYLAPVPKRGKRNEPAFTAHTAAIVGDLVGLGYEDIVAQTTKNFFTLFTKAQKPEVPS